MSWIQSAFGTKISPIILFVIVVLAVIFFVAALLHLLIRFLLKQRSPISNNYPESSASRTFQRQLQHLFNLHDSGLDQSLIDALPVFLYKDIMGLKEPFDCAVCLCEFSEQDKLRLLPLCSHAFHMDCIDTWLLSNSSCPLCRGVILSYHENPCFYFDESNENVESSRIQEFVVGVSSVSNKPCESTDGSAVISEKRVFSVRLGKYKSTISGDSSNLLEGDEVGETSGNSNLDDRRCYSMGSFQYVVADSELQVDLRHGREGDRENVTGSGRPNGNFTCDSDGGGAAADGKKIKVGESFSVSKIWLWSKKSSKLTSSRGIQFSNKSPLM